MMDYRTRRKESEVPDGRYRVLPPRSDKTTDFRRPQYRKNSKKPSDEFQERMEHSTDATVCRQKIE